MKAIYLHGPGFNANPERQILSATLLDAGLRLSCWDEPSRARPNGPLFRAEHAYQNALAAAEQFVLAESREAPVILVGHSFGANAVCHLASRLPAAMAGVVFVASGLAVEEVDLRIFQRALAIYQPTGDPRAEVIQAAVAAYRDGFGDAVVKGFGAVVESPGFFDGYWQDRARMQSYMSHYQGPYALDFEAFVAGRRTFFQPTLAASDIPAIAIFGKHDPIATPRSDMAVLTARFRNIRSFEFERSGHYPHIEETPRFIELLMAQ